MVYIAGVNRAVDTGNTYFGEIAKMSIAGSQTARVKLESRKRIKANGNLLFARCEYARWIVDCPNCHNAEFYFEDGLFECSACGLTGTVEMPPQRKAIEVILGKRLIINRHWNPGESLEKLQAENIKHGLEVG